MAILPLQLARVSNLVVSSTVQQQVTQTEQQLLQTQNQLSTGKRISVPSDDPGAAASVLQLQKTLNGRTSYLSNLSNAQSQLSEADSSLSDLTNLLQQAQTIASANVGSDVSSTQRAGAAAVVQSLYTQALSIGNAKFEGSYIYGGDKSTTAPFVEGPGGVEFVGSGNVLQNTVDENTSAAFQVSGAAVFGGTSSRVAGSADISPALSAVTRLVDLGGAGGAGVHLGSIQIGNGATSKTVDLSTASNVGDVINAINAAGVGNVTAAVSSSGIVLSTTGGDNITVQDVAGGTTAADLGIARTTGAGAGVTLSGASVHPKLTDFTPVSALKGGAGIDLTHGLKITNGQQSAAVTFAGASTVGDLINAINGSGTSVRAQINAAGTGIDILNPTQGSALTIGENGGTTASDLGVRSFQPSTPLSELNGGKGVRTVAGSNDIRITRSDGTNFDVSLSGLSTVQDVINKINTAAGGVGITAGFAATGNGITLTDTAGGGAPPTVAALKFSSAAADLGLTAPASGNTITGADVNPVTVSGVFADLAKLRDSLQNNDQAGITAAAQGLQTDHDQVVKVRGQAGAQVQEMQSRQDQIQSENLSTQSLISQLSDTDFAAAASKFATLQQALQATLETSGRLLNMSLLDFLQ